MENSILQKVKDAEKTLGAYEITGNEQARVTRLRKKLEESHMTVSVIGQFKRGKSALVNEILGHTILPVGIIPVTAVVTTVDYGQKNATVNFNNGMVKEVAFEDLSAYVNEQENHSNQLNVKKVAVQCQSEFLENNLTLVDTPGVGSVHEKNTKEAYAFVKESDAVIFTLSVDSPINQIEIDFLKKTKEYAAKFYYAVNKTDMINQEEINAYVGYCQKILSDIMESEDIKLFPVSALKGTGVEELKTTILKDMSTEGAGILQESVRLKLHDIALSALSQITLYRNALAMTGKEFEEKFNEIKEFFQQIHKETEALPEVLKNNETVCQLHANDVKNRLADKVKVLFGIEYHYDIEDVAEVKNNATQVDILSTVDDICSNLEKTLNAVFMHREENTYVVAKRIYGLNDVVRKLVKIRDEK